VQCGYLQGITVDALKKNRNEMNNVKLKKIKPSFLIRSFLRRFCWIKYRTVPSWKPGIYYKNRSK
jgi:hypothetical protein